MRLSRSVEAGRRRRVEMERARERVTAQLGAVDEDKMAQVLVRRAWKTADAVRRGMPSDAHRWMRFRMTPAVRDGLLRFNRDGAIALEHDGTVRLFGLPVIVSENDDTPAMVADGRGRRVSALERCERTELPPSMCSHCRGLGWFPNEDVAGLVDEAPAAVARGASSGLPAGILAERNSTCPTCGEPIRSGDLIVRDGARYVCGECATSDTTL